MSDEAMTLQRDLTYDERIVLEEDFLAGYEDWLSREEKRDNSIKAYLHWMTVLGDTLTEDRILSRSRIERWRYELAGEGYSPLSIKLAVSAVNSFLKYLGLGRTPIENLPDGTPTNQSELGRTEYLTLLMALRDRGAIRDYLIVKTLVTVDIIVKDLPMITVEACTDRGFTHPTRGRIRIPESLAGELFSYADKFGISCGPVFITKSGNNIDMSNVIGGIKRTGEAAGIDPDKCSSKAFHRLYLRTREELLADMQVMADGIYQEMLKSEEEKIESLRDKYDQSPV